MFAYLLALHLLANSPNARQDLLANLELGEACDPEETERLCRAQKFDGALMDALLRVPSCWTGHVLDNLVLHHGELVAAACRKEIASQFKNDVPRIRRAHQPGPTSDFPMHHDEGDPEKERMAGYRYGAMEVLIVKAMHLCRDNMALAKKDPKNNVEGIRKICGVDPALRKLHDVYLNILPNFGPYGVVEGTGDEDVGESPESSDLTR